MNERRYEAIFTRSRAGLLIVKVGACIVDANPAFCAMLGYTPEDLRGTDLTRIVHADDVADFQARVRVAIRQGIAELTSQKRFVHRFGHDIWTSSTITLVRDGDGQVELVEIVEDASGRRETERALQNSRALIEIAGRVARLGGWSIDLGSDRVEWSDEVALIHGERPGYAPTVAAALSYFVPEHVPLIREVFEHCACDGIPFDVELQICTRLGELKWVRTIGRAERAGDGRVVLVQGAFQEIGDRKRAEEAAQEVAERLQTTLESITDGFLTLDAQWRFTSLNRRAEEIIRRSRESLIGRNIWSEFPEAVHTPIYEQYHQAFERQVSTNFEFHYPKPYDLWVETAVYPSGQGIAVYFRDVTERHWMAAALDAEREALARLNAELEERVALRTAELELARNEAEEANRAKSTFLATMSHEIRTPMSGVVGMVDVLRETSLAPQQAEMVDLVRESGLSLLAIIDDILDFSKIEAGKLDLEHRPLLPARVVERVCSLFASSVRQDVRLSLVIDPAVPRTVMGDELRLRQVLLNMVGNAIKFSSGLERPGVVSVRVTCIDAGASPTNLEFEIADNGIGMDEGAVARLFTPFGQADASTTRRFGGTGLGLAISGMLVRLMRGEIAVDSVPGVGSRFRIRLPFELVTEEAETSCVIEPGAMTSKPGEVATDGAKQAVREGGHHAEGPPLILVAEDNTTNQKVIRHQLERMGLAGDVVANGREALDRWRSGDYALVLTDLHMPMMDGHELARSIRAEEDDRRTPIVALTANAVASEEARCREAGIDCYLTKPVRLPKLKQVIDELLRMARAPGESTAEPRA
jgi:PAS domain S-box-containing protein